MIKVPGTPFFPEAVISFSKAPHFNGYANFRSFWDFVWRSFYPTKLVDIGVSTVETCSINSFCCRHFCWILLKSHTLFFEHTSRFSALTSLKSDVFFVDCAQIGSAPPCVHTIFQQVTFRKRIGSKIERPGHQLVKIEEEGRRRWGERLYSPESLSKLRVSWLAWTYSKPEAS